MKVLFYGRLADVLGSELEVGGSAGCSIGQLRDRLIAEHPAAEQPLRNKRARAIVDDALVHDDYVPRATDLVQFLPPVSGG